MKASKQIIFSSASLRVLSRRTNPHNFTYSKAVNSALHELQYLANQLIPKDLPEDVLKLLINTYNDDDQHPEFVVYPVDLVQRLKNYYKDISIIETATSYLNTLSQVEQWAIQEVLKAYKYHNTNETEFKTVRQFIKFYFRPLKFEEVTKEDILKINPRFSSIIPKFKLTDEK